MVRGLRRIETHTNASQIYQRDTQRHGQARTHARLVHAKRAGGELGGVVDGARLELRVSLPVLVEDEEELLRPAKREDGNQAPAAAADDGLDGLREALLAGLPGLVLLGAVPERR